MTYAISSTVRQDPVDESARTLCGRKQVAYARRMTEGLEDTALMMRYKDGDVAAFETLYRRRKDSLYRYLLRLCLNPAIAEDLFQETWQKIIRARESYRPAAKFSTYLFRVAHNCFIDHVRRARRHGEVADDKPDARPHPGESPESATERSMARRRLDTALTEIPADQRDAYLLYEEGGLGIDDIALVTGVNRETAKSRLRYAVAKLRLAIDPDSTGKSRE
jgi:RNA polymerase sigma-70 factor (ECF subfamily)